MKKVRKYGLFLTMILCITAFIAGCGQKEEKETESQAKAEIQDVMEIPSDGTISEDIFAAFADTDRSITFQGKDGSISYEWIFEGKKVQNPVSQNLKLTFTKDGMEEIKEKANHASCGIGFTAQESDLAAAPKVQVTLDEAWDVDTVILCKEQEGNLVKITDAEIDNSQEHTALTFSMPEADGTYYLVGGNSAGQAKKETAKEDITEDTTEVETEIITEIVEETVDSQEQEEGQNVCTVSISCATILDRMDELTEGKEEFVPADGWILAPSQIAFEEGESAFDILKRACQEAGIQMESSMSPVYESAYVEGINQLYEFDCGSLSGWMYNVNGWFPNYGCSKYYVSDGDVINWVFTCDLGEDVGNTTGGQEG